MFEYAGRNTWEKPALSPETTQGKWSQSFYQVDDALTIKKYNDNQMMFMPFFSKAQNIVDGQEYDRGTSKAQIEEMLMPFIQ
jgi:hypothetical protein